MDDRVFWLTLRRALLMVQGDAGVQARPVIRRALAIAVGAINCRYNLGKTEGADTVAS